MTSAPWVASASVATRGAARDTTTLRSTAHTLKGTAGNFGAERVVAAARRLEELAASDSLGEADGALRELEAALMELRQALTPHTAAEAIC